MRLTDHLLTLAAAACVGLACSGSIAEPGGVDSQVNQPGRPQVPSGRPGDPSGMGPNMGAKSAGPMPLRRLGKQELQNTLRDLLPAVPAGFDTDIELPADNDVLLAFSLPGTVSDLEVRRLMDLSEAALRGLGANQPAAKVSCNGMDETGCARDFVIGFGKRAFRRPLDKIEVDDLMALYSKLRTDPEMKYGLNDALGIVVEAMLQSPGFLYRWERGLAAPQKDGSLVKLDGYEIASRLSYYIWGSMPDAMLMAAADAGKLATVDGIAVEAERLLRSPRADGALTNFATQWLEIGPVSSLIKDAKVYPDFKPELRASIQAETESFVKDVLRGPSPTLSNLLTANYTLADAALAQYYGLPLGPDGRVSLEGSPRRGLLTQASFLAVKGNSYRTSPVRRGKLILNRLLCRDVPPPPPEVVPELPPPDPNLTLREQLAEHRANPGCAVCHDTMDALGLAFEHFDGAGKYRERDGAFAVDASGSVVLDNATVSFRGASDLIAALAASPQVQECFVKQWLRFALGRFEQDVDSATVDALLQTHKAANRNTRDLILTITKALPFTHRAPSEGEVLAP